MKALRHLRVVLMGYGEMGRRYHLPVLGSFEPRVRLVGIVRANPKSSVDCDVPVFGSLSDAVRDTRPNVVIVATPHGLHGHAVRFALEADCHVLVEKPISVSYAEASNLTDMSERRGLILLVGLQRRYEGFCGVVEELRNVGRIGRVRMAHGLFAHRFEVDALAGWRSTADLGGAGILHDTGVHLLDTLLYCAGDNVMGVEGAQVDMGDSGVPVAFCAVLRLAQGGTLAASASYEAPRGSVQEEYSIYGDEGSVFARRFRIMQDTTPPSVCWKSSDGASQKEYALDTRPIGREIPLRRFLEVLLGERERKDLVSEGKAVLETHRVVHLILRAAKGASGCRNI